MLEEVQGESRDYVLTRAGTKKRGGQVVESGPRVPDPQRVVVASYGSYAEAQRAVDYLSDEGFSVERVAIVAEDLRLVEQVTGRMGYGRAALQGAGFGAMSGVILGFFSGFLFSSFNPLASAPYLAILWLIYGAIIGFSSVEGIQAARYNVMADEEVADEASQLLAWLQPPSGDEQSKTALEHPSRTREEVLSPRREEVTPETQSSRGIPPRGEPETSEDPLSEERLQRPRAMPPSDAPGEAPPPNEGQPRRPGEERPKTGLSAPKTKVRKGYEGVFQQPGTFLVLSI
jgi:hypothetical protein